MKNQTTIVRDGHTFTMLNCKIHPRLSHETICFWATLNVDGRLFANISNRGCGGAHEINAIGSWEPWLKKADIDAIIDELLDEFEEQEFIRKNQDKGLLLKKTDSCRDPFACPKYSIGKYRMGGKGRVVKLSLLIANGYLETIQADAQKFRQEGFEVLNTNF